MDFKTDEPKAILAKSLVLIQKAVTALTQLDHWRFPTDSSEDARTLLLKAHDCLRDPANLAPIDAAVLYNRLFCLQELLDLVERSSTAHISWPLVSYCDEFWRKFFGDGKTKIFYSVTPEHNYCILPFTKRLSFNLRGVLSSKDIDALTGGSELYCLQLASSEDANLPLYANIGHEFGHAVYDVRESALLTELNASFGNVISDIFSDLQKNDAVQCRVRFRRTARAIVTMAEELFCDLVGTMLMGPAFLLSLYEIAWGETKAVCKVRLTPDEHSIRAYPSFHFRLHCIYRSGRITDFRNSARSEFAQLPALLHSLATCLGTVPIAHHDDTVKVLPASDDDASAIQTVLERHLPRIKQAMEQFLTTAATELSNWYRDAFPSIVPKEIAELLERLENNILPNIIPTDGSPLLGKPASFMAILNACALYRLHLLTTYGADKSSELSRRMGIVERLTAKALEVSFIQHEYNRWETVKHGSP